MELANKQELPHVILLLGRIDPEGIRVAFSDPLKVSFTRHSHGTTHFSISTIEKRFEIRCELPSPIQDEEWPDLLMRAQSFGQAGLNLVSFQKGVPLKLTIIEAVLPNGKKLRLRHHFQFFENACKAFKLDDDTFPRAFNSLISDPNLFLALDDLIRAPEYGPNAPINCARMLDALRKNLTPNRNDKTQWQEFRRRLNITKPYLQEITSSSKEPRHGNRTALQQLSISDLCSKSAVVMNRFLELRLSGVERLSETDFPNL